MNAESVEIDRTVWQTTCRIYISRRPCVRVRARALARMRFGGGGCTPKISNSVVYGPIKCATSVRARLIGRMSINPYITFFFDPAADAPAACECECRAVPCVRAVCVCKRAARAISGRGLALRMVVCTSRAQLCAPSIAHTIGSN